MDGWIGGWMDGWADGRLDGWMSREQEARNTERNKGLR